MALIPRGYRPESDPQDKEENQSKKPEKTEKKSRADEKERSNELAEQDGRNKEWQDRSRVNMEEPDPDAKTNLERDFEPESRGYRERDDTPIY